MKHNVGNVRGTRDFLPSQKKKRDYIFSKVQELFEIFGFNSIETPSLEKSETLLGKYGDEGDRLIFKVLNSGDFLKGLNDHELNDHHTLGPKITEKALRYDLTVPFARFVTQHQNELNFPFKRYQIQPVWRADRPQKGRYREFYQCDVDIIGSNSLHNEFELLRLINKVFNSLNIERVSTRINNRKVLEGLCEVFEETENFIQITTILDKLDKVGMDGVIKELTDSGIKKPCVDGFKTLLSENKEDYHNSLKTLEDLLGNNAIGIEGLTEINWIFNNLKKLNITGVFFDLSLARGLNYYTGCIFEVVTDDFPGSLCGGGRYDNLCEIFGLPDMSGVGISFGADRIYDLMEQRDLFAEDMDQGPTIVFLNLGQIQVDVVLTLMDKLQSHLISAMIYPDEVKMKKQMKYANQINAKYVGILGDKELQDNTLVIKNLADGNQVSLPLDQTLEFLRANCD